jgi:hypothetical protein
VAEGVEDLVFHKFRFVSRSEAGLPWATIPRRSRLGARVVRLTTPQTREQAKRRSTAGVLAGLPITVGKGGPTLDVERWTLDVERWTLDVERWTLDVERWTLSA